MALATATTIGVWILARGASPPTTPSTPSSPAAVVSDSDGFTLYRFDESSLPLAQRRTDPRVDPFPDRRLLSCDASTPPDWPVVGYEQNRTLPALRHTLLGYLERADGRRQLTINGCPVYRYRGDRTPGQTTGDGAAGTWFTLRPVDLK
jgi:predicted lipoprotein with Yx(FWY)xxD motif